MRKLSFALIVVVLLLLFVSAQSAESYTEQRFDSANVRFSLPDSMIILRENNLSDHPELLAKIGCSAEELLTDWSDRGVLMQAWNQDGDVCLEFSVVQDDDARQYFDIDQQTNQVRAAWRTSHIKGTTYTNKGYSIKSAEWKKQTKGGRFLMIKYKRTWDGLTYWGYARRTIRNGQTYTLDWQVYNRSLRTADSNTLNKIANTVEFTSSSVIPASSAGFITYTAVPPLETNSSTFTVEGKCAPQAHLIGVLMRMTTGEKKLIEADANKTGAFKMKVDMPSEGVWQLTLTVESNGTEIADEVFDPTTYQATLLPLALDSMIPDEFPGDEYTITGKTSKNVTVQCIVTAGGTPVFEKMIRTNATGRFTFKVPTSVQASYEVTLVLEKKGFSTRRKVYTANRNLTEEDIRAQYRATAVKPAYSTLTKKLDAYINKVVGYTVFIESVEQVGDEWIIRAALNKSEKGVMKNSVIIVAPDDPGFEIGSKQKMYGICIGSYQIQSEEGTASYPSFDLLFFD